ncbi:MAG: ATP-binding protein [Alphaproteobacteria bacterium]
MTRDTGTVIPILPSPGRRGRPGAPRSSGVEALGSLEDAFHDLLHHSGLAVYICDAGTNRLHINEAFRDLYNQMGAPPVRGETDALPVPAALQDVIDEVKRAGRRVIRAEQIDYPAQSRFYRAHHFPVFRGTQLSAVAGVYYDVTSQTQALSKSRESQGRLDDILRSTSDWVWESDAEGALTFISDRITEILGRPPATLVGRRLLDFGRFPDRPAAPRGALFLDARPFRNRLFEIRDLNGDTREVHLSGVPVFSAETGKLVGYRGTGTDISAQKKAEELASKSKRALEDTLEELQNKNRQLEAALDQVLIANRAKGEFLATMSHELRTPLNAIIGFAEVILLNTFGEMPAKYHTYIREIINAGRHLLTKIEEILDVARAENNTLKIEPKACSLAEVLDQAAQHITMRAKEKEIDISRVKVDRDWTVVADPERARQIFANLLSNAVKFTPEKGAVGLDVHPAAGNMLAVTVWDTGIGIPLEKQEAIFESFQQIHDGIFRRTQEGTGLGLTVARHLAILMGGNITLESWPGQGSRFTVTLPLAEQKPKE